MSHSDAGLFSVICQYATLLRYLAQLLIVLLLLSLFSVPFVPPGTASYYMMLLNFIMLVPLLLVVLVFAYVCQQRRSRKTVDAVTDETRELSGDT